MSNINSGYDSNGSVLSVGDHLRSPRLGYTHHGLYVGGGSVIHYSGFANGMSSGVIEVTTIDAFRNDDPFYIESHLFRLYDGDESVDRAYSRLGEDWYNVLLNNCEHFVTWCINGVHSSSQVNMTVEMIAAAYKAQQAAEAAKLAVNVASGLTAASAGAATTTLTTSTVAGIATGAAAGAGISFAGGASTAAVGLVAGTAAAPVVVAAGVAVAAGYGVKKIWDWFTD